jgi:predicted nuclease with TOPRIM domain
MKITKLTIDNIRSHIHTDIPMDRLTVITGSNHSGKSTIGMAIEFALTGRCEITDEAGRGQASLLSHGATKGAVALELTHGNSTPAIFRATLTASNGRDIGMRSPEDKTWDPSKAMAKFSADRNVLSCLINNRYFVNLKPDAQKKLLASIVLPATYNFDPAIQLDMVEAGLVATEDGPFERIEQLYKQAFEKRRGVNAALKNFVVPAVPIAEVDAPTPEAIRARVEQLQQERNTLAVERERRQGNYNTLTSKLSGLSLSLQQIESRLHRATVDLDNCKALQLSKEKLAELKKIAGDAKKAKALDEELILLEGEMASNYAILDKLAGLGENQFCPTCEQKIEGEYLAKVTEPLVEHRNKLIRDQREKQDLRKALGDYEGAEKQLADHKRAAEDLKTVTARYNEVAAELIEQKKKIEELGNPEGPPDDAEGPQIEALDKRILGGMNALSQAGNAQAAAMLREEALKRRDDLQADLVRLEKLVAYFGPGDTGIKVKLIAEHIGGFQDGINVTLNQWGYEARLSIEPYRFQVIKIQRQSDGELLFAARQYSELYQLSGSELYRFSVAFQVALALHSGYGFVVIDTADILDGAGTSAFFRALYSSGLSQAIVLGTGVPNPNQAPGVIFIDLVDTPEGTQVRVVQHNVAEEVHANA